ncbi:uncharacterized protein LOC117173529 [Belonocnema kinseyi]|uniref:uncharacterized protein LOC117173529 n=1 Tax=Belonocnema kinseyi TaxID=2817044 RepID=UPI00143D7495|nr:uncharacterized protein LOC117173529 [Belonocnema kinseyi]
MALAWINTEPNTLKTFVANRVTEIQSLTQPHKWLHVPTQDNPADLISRGQSTQDFLESSLWKNGPLWLSQDSDMWPQFPLIKTDVLEKGPIRTTIVSLTLIISNPKKQAEIFVECLIEKYSSLRTLKHVIAYCQHFIKNTDLKNKKQRSLSPLSNEELDAGIIRVGGRIEHANIPQGQKHPIVLPHTHHITTLIIREEHIKRKHAGVQATLYGVRESFWPIDSRNTTRRIIRRSVRCFRVKPRGIDCIMGSLPEKRLTYSCLFLHVGVDYCGPFYIKEKRHRNRGREKVYVSIFVCFTTKAVHLDLVYGLTTEAFLDSLSKFFSRQGKAITVHSDNGTNFVGANKELRDLYEFIQKTKHDPDVKKFLSNERMNWNFNPPSSPHFGGLWEAPVK